MTFSIVRPTTRLCFAMLLLLQGTAVADAWFFSSFPCIFGIFCSNDDDSQDTSPPPPPPPQLVITVPPPQLGGGNNNNVGDPAEKKCNGISGLCDLRASEVMFGMVHNAMATKEDNFRFFPNHNSQLEDALAAGFRGISLDVCQCVGNRLSFCHGSCVLGTRSIEDVMGHISEFLDKNPNEVIMINLQMDGRASRVVDIQELSTEFNEVAPGLVDKLYIHPNRGLAWPTLGSLVDSGKQVLLFHHNGPNCDTSYCPPGFHDWFKYAAETEFSFSNVDDILDTGNSCQITRGASSVKHFFQVNSFVTLPNQDASEVLNSLEFAQDHVESCSLQNGGLDVNVLSVDFWKSGNIAEVVAENNAALVDRRRRMLLLAEDEEDFGMMMEEYNAL